ncbi:MutS-related protein [Edaphobacter modestus]|uniref:MutS-related protein n=1 Tax=Edaphobacter modestus TaxID=388466 RepID=UPI00102C87A5|nr:mismatch repair protein [Edaphobacter modestus]
MPDPTLPSEEYLQRQRARELRVAHFEAIHIRLGNLRLLLVLLEVAAIFFYLRTPSFSGRWLLVPLVLFIAVAVFHSKTLQRQSLAKRAVDFYRHGLARIEDRWQGMGQLGDRFDISTHLYAADLDLFGHGSLYQLLSVARTRMGEDTLASWLLQPSPLPAILERHTSLADLRSRIDYREDMAILSDNLQTGVHPAELTQWAQSPRQLKSRFVRWLALLLTILMLVAAAFWIDSGVKAPFFTVVFFEGILVLLHRSRVESILHQTEHALDDLQLLSSLLARMEQEPFAAPALLALKERLSTSSSTASQAIARLDTICQHIQSLENPLMRLLDIPFLYSVQLAFVADAWRHRYGSAVIAWLATLGEMEALLSLATYSYEHPAYPFPDFLSGEPAFHAVSLGHPLIPDSRCVRNDIALGDQQRVVLISGSNMSGKSTLMRAVGINTVLAMAGAPVHAGSLQLTPLRVGASILVNDSLQKGSSRFYAEITRLRHIHDLADQDPPLLFLLDELLQGTNSRDRLIGAEGIVNALLSTNAIGIISTHDLALTALKGDSIHNMHFQDEIEDGKMKFDFKLRNGPVTRSNGVELMRLIGLDV